MKKEEIIKCLQKATKKNVTEKGVEWKLLYEDGADAILKLAAQPDVSGNEANLSENKKEGEVALRFCQDEVARKYGYLNWDNIIECEIKGVVYNGTTVLSLNYIIYEVAELYRQNCNDR